jgi:hypothetical protein
MIDRARQEVLATPHAPTAQVPGEGARPGDQSPAQGDSTLVPMLISSLVLIVIAMAGVMAFA